MVLRTSVAVLLPPSGTACLPSWLTSLLSPIAQVAAEPDFGWLLGRAGTTFFLRSLHISPVHRLRQRYCQPAARLLLARAPVSGSQAKPSNNVRPVPAGGRRSPRGEYLQSGFDVGGYFFLSAHMTAPPARMPSTGRGMRSTSWCGVGGETCGIRAVLSAAVPRTAAARAARLREGGLAAAT